MKFSKEKLLRFALMNLIDGVVIVNYEGRLVFANSMAREILQLPQKAESRKLLPMVKDKKIKSSFKQLLLLRDWQPFEILFEKDERSFACYFSPLIEEGKFNGGICILRELTELKNIERGMLEFVGNVSHELKTPLTSIKGFVETLLEGAISDPEITRNFLRIINEEANRLVRLIINLLYIAQAYEPKEKKLNYTLVDLKELLSQCLEILKPFAEQYKLEFVINWDDTVSIVTADKDQIKQVFVNILDNAIKYTGLKKEGKITISSEDKGEFVQIKIKDTGGGIPEEALPNIFNRFYRVERKPFEEIGGTGLGLSITKGIIEAHKGNIWLDSEYGKGTTVYFTLPKKPVKNS